MTFHSGTRLGPYEIVARIGAGGMGEVYRARDTRLGREVALKVLPDRLTSDPDAMLRFQREARAASALNHPHIVVVHDIGSERIGDEDVPYYTMELVDGTTLGERFGRDALPKVLGYFVQVADALAKAHSAGIVHRDLKPDNVMVSHDGYAKVVDFGLAKQDPAHPSDTKSPTVAAPTAVGSIVGTVSYMSPEQVEARPLDGRSDVFAFGSMLYEALTGRRPFDGRSSVDTMHAIVHAAPPPLADSGRALPLDLQRVIDRCLMKTPDDRYQSTKEAAIELRRLIRDLESGALRGASTSGARRPSRRQAIAALAVVAAIVAALVAAGMWTRQSPAIRSLAILPFANASRNADTDYISDGITDEIINSLSQLTNVRVLARSTVFRYKGVAAEPREVGKQLVVDAVVLGELRQLHDLVNVNVELVRTTDGVQLWGQQYNLKASDLVSIVDEIARDVTQHLQLRLSGDEARRVSRRHTQDPQAYEAYLKGRYFWNLRPAGLDKALAYFEEARRIDPGDALAHAGVALAYGTMGAWESGRLAPDVAFPKAKASAQQALALDPELADAYAALGFVQFNHERDFAAAEENLRKATRLKPSDSTAHHWLSHLFMARGRVEDSLHESLRALELDPVDPVIMVHLGWHYIYARQPDRALQQSATTFALHPTSVFNFYNRGLAYEQKGLLKDAAAAFQQAHDLLPTATYLTAALGHALALANRRAEAQAVLQELDALHSYVSPFDRAMINIGLGDHEKAVDNLEKAVAEHSSWSIYYATEPRLDPLRQDPRFVALVQRASPAQ